MYLLLENISDAKYHKNQRNIYQKAANLLVKHPGYVRNYHHRKLVDDMMEHAKNSDKMYKLNMDLAKRRLFDKEPERHLSSLKERIFKQGQRTSGHKTKMKYRAEWNGMSNLRKAAVNAASKILKKKVGKAPEFQKGERVFPKRGNLRICGDPRYGHLANNCVMTSIHHATGIHPGRIVHAFTRLQNKPHIGNWSLDKGASDEQKKEVLHILGHSHQEIPTTHPTKSRYYTAGEIAKKHPDKNLLASTIVKSRITGKTTGHSFNIKYGKIHDDEGFANENSPVRHALHIEKLNYHK